MHRGLTSLWGQNCYYPSVIAGPMQELLEGKEMSIGRGNANPILDTRQYVAEFGDEEQAEYGTNVIAEPMDYQVHSEGHHQ